MRPPRVARQEFEGLGRALIGCVRARLTQLQNNRIGYHFSLAGGASDLQRSFMKQRVAVIGAGVSGLTTAIVLVERGYDVSIFADQVGQKTTSGAAAAIWFPYDAEPADKVIAWALETFKVFVDLSRDRQTGVSMIELRQFSRTGEIQIPDWAHSLGGRRLANSAEALSLCAASNSAQADGYSITVPLADTTIYLDHLRKRLTRVGAAVHGGIRFKGLGDVDPAFDHVVNCTGFGARDLASDMDLQPHRGQVAIVPKIHNLACAIVCDDDPLIYAIPRTNDCVLGGTNELSEDLAVNPTSTARILAECRRVLRINMPQVVAERVGIRPFRKSGVRVERDRLRDGRTIVHNYGHGGAGFTLSWGCALEAVSLLTQEMRS
jgi:D-amino-acid oxidase